MENPPPGAGVEPNPEGAGAPKGEGELCGAGALNENAGVPEPSAGGDGAGKDAGTPKPGVTACGVAPGAELG